MVAGAPSSPANPVAARHPFDLLRKRFVFPLCLLLFLLVCSVFYPITGGDFINYDDDVYVTDNFHVQGGPALEQVSWAFSNTDSANWHPVTWLSHMLDYQLYGGMPWGHHLTSVLIHALNTVLLFVVMLRMTGALWRSLFVALLFGLHPLRVESVAWVSERKDVLSSLFWMLTLWAYVEYAKSKTIHPRRANLNYWLTLVFFALGLMSKPMVVTLPFVLLLLDYWPLGRIYNLRFAIDEPKDLKVLPLTKTSGAPHTLSANRKSQIVLRDLIWEKAPFFLMSAAGCVITFLAQQSKGAVIDYLPFINRLENAVLAYGRYLGKFLCPINLAILYPHPVSWPLVKIFAATMLLLSLTAAVFVIRRSRPYCVVGWLWFIGTLVPVIGLVQVGSQSMADRYMYLPCIGLNIILAWGVCDLVQRLHGRQTALVAATMAVIVSCAALTRHQINFWKDSGTVFGHAVAVTENNYQARKALGDFYWSQGRLNEALDLYRQAIQMYPRFEGAHLNLGAVLNETGHAEQAVDEFKQAINLKPDDPAAYNDLGAVLGQGHLDESIRLFQKAIQLDPNYADAHKNLGQAMDQLGRTEEAIVQYQKAIRLKPNSDAHYLLGIDLEKLGRKNEAIAQFTETLRFQSNNASARRALDRLQK